MRKTSMLGRSAMRKTALKKKLNDNEKKYSVND